MAALPPVTQVFEVDAAAFLAGIDEMLASVERLATAIDEVAVAADEMGAAAGAADERLAAGADEVTAAADRMSEATDVAAEADERLSAAEQLAAIDAERQAAAIDALVASCEETVAATDEAAAAIDRENVALAETGKTAAGAEEETAAFGGGMKTALLGVAIAAGVGLEQAGKFQQGITQLHTQAGVATSSLGTLSQGVLKLAGTVGQGPESLTESLYHVESNMASLGISTSKALSMVQIAAEGADVGRASLVDVTNALTAAVASGIPGVQNYQQAMGALNATVGAGDMQMQDLADAMGTGMLAVVKGYGLSLTDVGAALATFGDNNIRGAKAGTDLRMSVQALAVPLSTAAPQLSALGMSSKTLANDMENGGLMKALDDLTTRFQKNGITAKNEGEVITSIFGKKAGAGVSILLEQMGRLQSKYPAITKAANEFGGAWADQQKTLSQNWADLKDGADALAISFGNVLLPAATKVLGALAGFGRFLESHGALAAFAGAMLLVAGAFKLVATAEALFDAATDANPVMLVILAVIALAAGLYELYTHFKIVRDIVADVGQFFKTVWQAAVHAAGAVVQWFVTGPLAFIRQQLAAFAVFWAAHGQQIMTIARAVWSQISAIIELAWSIASAVVRTGLVILSSAWDLTWGIIRDTVVMVWNVIADVVRTAIHLVLDTVGIVLDLLTGKWGAAWHGLIKLASDALNGAVSVVKSIASGFGNLLWDAGASIIRGLIGGIESMFGSVGSVMGSLGNLIKSFLPNSPAAKRGPLSGAGDLSYSGRTLAQHLAQGLTDGSGDVHGAMTHLAGAAGLLPGGLAVAGAGGGTGGSGATAVGPISLTVNGFIGSQQELLQQLYLMFQTSTLQANRRNATNGLSLAHT